jgi:hypothetical protein
MKAYIKVIELQLYTIAQIGQEMPLRETKLETWFFEQYFLFLQAIEEVSKVSPAVLSFERPEGTEGTSLSYNAVTPIQLRFYRQWADVLQSTKALAGFKPDVLRTPIRLTPSS